MGIIKVGATSEAGAVASSIVKAVLEQRRADLQICVEVRAVAPLSISTAIKAVIIASGLLTVQGVDLLVKPYFEDGPGNDGGVITVIVMRLIERP